MPGLRAARPERRGPLARRAGVEHRAADPRASSTPPRSRAPVVANHAEAVGAPARSRGRVAGVAVRDTLGGRTRCELRARLVVNAAGPVGRRGRSRAAASTGRRRRCCGPATWSCAGPAAVPLRGGGAERGPLPLPRALGGAHDGRHRYEPAEAAAQRPPGVPRRGVPAPSPGRASAGAGRQPGPRGPRPRPRRRAAGSATRPRLLDHEAEDGARRSRQPAGRQVHDRARGGGAGGRPRLPPAGPRRRPLSHRGHSAAEGPRPRREPLAERARLAVREEMALTLADAVLRRLDLGHRRLAGRAGTGRRLRGHGRGARLGRAAAARAAEPWSGLVPAPRPLRGRPGLLEWRAHGCREGPESRTGHAMSLRREKAGSRPAARSGRPAVPPCPGSTGSPRARRPWSTTSPSSGTRRGLLRSTLEHVVGSSRAGGRRDPGDRAGGRAGPRAPSTTSPPTGRPRSSWRYAVAGARRPPRAGAAGGGLAGRDSAAGPRSARSASLVLHEVGSREPSPRPRGPRGARQADGQRARERAGLRRAARLVGPGRGPAPHHRRGDLGHATSRPSSPPSPAELARPPALRPPRLRLRQRHRRLHRDGEPPRGHLVGPRRRPPGGG